MTDLEPEITAWVEAAAGGRVTSLRQVPAGGRTGFLVDVQTQEGATRELFLQRGGRGGLGSFMGFEREAEVYRALEPLGIPIPHVWGVDEQRDVFLVDRASGQAWFQAPRDPVEALDVAKDFMAHLAAWHRAGARSLELPSFGRIQTVEQHQRDQLAGIRAAFEAEDASEPIDLLAKIQIEHLLNNVPKYDGEPVLVQGDTGPGNFMYDDGRVTAIIDWELAHIGDPMDDIAWLSWRATQHGWPDFPARLGDYESASGIEVDPARVFYYRLNACARLGPGFGLADMGQESRRRRRVALAGGSDASLDRTADGSGFIMNMLHRRMRLSAQADALGIELPGREVGEQAEESSEAYLYDGVLGQLEGIVDRVEDRVAANLAKAAARQLKYLKEAARNGALFEAHELDDLGRLLGVSQSSLEEGRSELAAVAREGRIEHDDYLLYHWQRLIRDDHLMKAASGSMYERGWPALV